MNNDLISRSALKKVIEDSVSQYGSQYSADMLNMWALFSHIVNDAPTVEITEEQAIDKLRETGWLPLHDKEMTERPHEWIPVSEKLPDDLEPVNITWINHEPEPYYKEIKDKPFTATGVLFHGQWYWWSTLCTDMLAEYHHNHDDIIDKDIEIIAWMPLPEPYKEAENDHP